MIVITAPTGNIGRQVLEHVVSGQEAVRVIVRNPDRIPLALREKVEVVTGSHSQYDVVSRAFDGAESVFWLPPGEMSAASVTDAYVEFSRPGIEAMRRSGVERVVGISALGRGWGRDAGHVTATLMLDDMIAQAGVSYRALACGSLMENILRQVDRISHSHVLSWPSPQDLPMPLVASRDVATVAGKLLIDQTWSGVDSIPMMGPHDITFQEMAAIISESIGQPVRFQEITMQDMRAMLIAGGASEGMVLSMIAMLTAKNEGLDQLVDRRSLGIDETDFHSWCSRVLAPEIAAAN
jgi:uncharacterized protein YbjT (DUF2867 family)